MDRNTELDLEALHDAIVVAIRAQFPDLLHVEFYRDERTPPSVPSCLLELTELEASPELDPGTEQLAVTAHFEARLILGFREPRVKLEARKLAAAFAAWLRLRRWPGVTTGPAMVVGAHPDDYEPELDQFEVWCVEWQQVIHLGSTVWKNDGVIPARILTAFSPEVGIPYEDGYTEVTAP